MDMQILLLRENENKTQKFDGPPPCKTGQRPDIPHPGYEINLAKSHEISVWLEPSALKETTMLVSLAPRMLKS